jgi:hypothetical protein
MFNTRVLPLTFANVPMTSVVCVRACVCARSRSSVWGQCITYSWAECLAPLWLGDDVITGDYPRRFFDSLLTPRLGSTEVKYVFFVSLVRPVHPTHFFLFRSDSAMDMNSLFHNVCFNLLHTDYLRWI